MSTKPVTLVFALALVLTSVGGARVWAQDGAKAKDGTLESLLKDLDEPEKPAAKSDKPGGADKNKGGSAADKAGKPPRSSQAGEKSGKASAGDAGKPSAPKSKSGDGKVAPKDQALDDLLEKLGETKDQPAAEDRPQSGAPGGEPNPAPREKAGADKLGEKDEDLDQRLEELTGRKKKRSSSDQERSGPVGEMIKEMREVEERLGKPDPSEDTQKKQKQIVKRIESMIEQAKQSGSSGGKMVVRRVPRPGDQQQGQQGDQTGAQARGAPPMKPARPTSQHSTANGKEVWGHLPDELRQMMESTFKEEMLDSKRELITRYFLSVAKGKPVREE
jgi:hypothetical protein